MITALNGEAWIIFLALQQAPSYSLSFHPHLGSTIQPYIIQGERGAENGQATCPMIQTTKYQGYNSILNPGLAPKRLVVLWTPLSKNNVFHWFKRCRTNQAPEAIATNY